MTSAEALPGAYVVVDSSVSLKWALNDEEHVDEALALRDDALDGKFVMVAPSVWYFEVTNGLVTAARRGRINAADGRQALVAILSLGVRFADPAAEEIYDECLQRGVAAYDAAYLVLAQLLRVPVWTGDRHFYNAVQALTDSVRWIGSYPRLT